MSVRRKAFLDQTCTPEVLVMLPGRKQHCHKYACPRRESMLCVAHSCCLECQVKSAETGKLFGDPKIFTLNFVFMSQPVNSQQAIVERAPNLSCNL